MEPLVMLEKKGTVIKSSTNADSESINILGRKEGIFEGVFESGKLLLIKDIWITKERAIELRDKLIALNLS